MLSARSLKPMLNPGSFVFCSGGNIDLAREEVIGYFREEEGRTFIIAKDLADQLGIVYESVFSWITLRAQTSLDEVGLTAFFSAALARAGISCNVVAGYHHDHLFVLQRDEKKALTVLSSLTYVPRAKE